MANTPALNVRLVDVRVMTFPASEVLQKQLFKQKLPCRLRTLAQLSDQLNMQLQWNRYNCNIQCTLRLLLQLTCDKTGLVLKLPTYWQWKQQCEPTEVSKPFLLWYPSCFSSGISIYNLIYKHSTLCTYIFSC